MKLHTQALTTAIILTSVHVTSAAGVADCDNALVRATYNSSEGDLQDTRLAASVSESTWSKLKDEAGASGTIYGVPVNASFGKFRSSFSQNGRSDARSYSRNTFRNVAWIGLDQNATNAYTECLESVRRKNLVLIPKTATSSDVSFELVYTVIGNSPVPLPVRWRGGESTNNDLPSSVEAGATTIVIKRPSSDSTLAVSGGGLTDSIVVTPVPVRPPPFTEQVKHNYTFRVQGTVTHSTSMLAIKTSDYEFDSPKFELNWPNVSGISKFQLTFIEFDNGKRCAAGSVSESRENFNQMIASEETKEGPVFSGGAQVSRDGSTIQVFLNPKNNCI